MTPSYLVDFLKLSQQSMGFILSATGLGALLGGLLLPAASDVLGRRYVMLGSAAAAALALWGFMIAPANPTQLFLLLMAVAGFGFSIIYINVGPLTFESVPAAVASTAVGMVVGIGEIAGGGIAPSLAGYIANHYGIEHVFGVALTALIASALLALGLKEPQKPSLRAEHGLPGEEAAS